MIRRASLEDVRNGIVLRRPNKAYLVVAMQIYPRFLAKSLIDEYQRSLSPEAELFAEYRELCKLHEDHETAFNLVSYEERFDLGTEGRENLARLTVLADTYEVHLICRCKPEQHCHVDLILLMAECLYQGKIPKLPFEYERFRVRFG